MATDHQGVERVTNVPNDRRPRRVLPDEEAHDELWRGLIKRYRDAPRYRALASQDLAPLWHEAKEGSPSLGDRIPRFSALLENVADPAGGGSPKAHAAQLRYVKAVLSAVTLTLRLTSDKHWSMPAAESLHDDVSNKQRGVKLRPSPTLIAPPKARAKDDDRLELRLILSANFVGFELTGRDPNADGELFFVEKDTFDLSLLGFGYDSQHWETLEDLGCNVVRHAVAEVRSRVEAAHPFRNSSHIDRWEDDLDLLVRCLFHRHRVADRASQQRLRRLCDRLGIDFRHGPDAVPDPAAFLNDVLVEETSF